MYDLGEHDLVLASTEKDCDSTKMYQIHHKLAQCQLKLKKRRESVASLESARKHLVTANVSFNDKVKFETVLKDSIKKISKRIIESKAEDDDKVDLTNVEISKSISEDFTPHQGKLVNIQIILPSVKFKRISPSKKDNNLFFNSRNRCIIS